MSVTSMLNRRWSDIGRSSAKPGHEEHAHHELVAGDFRLDFDTRKAYLHERELLLNPAEFDVLRYLISHRKMLVTPQTLLSTTCDALRARRTDFMKTLVSLKKKLDETSDAQPYLHLEPWVLYEFELSDSR